MIYVKINSANHSTYREIEGNTFDFYKIYISYPREREGFSPEGYSGRVQHFEIGIRTEVEKVELVCLLHILKFNPKYLFKLL